VFKRARERKFFRQAATKTGNLKLFEILRKKKLAIAQKVTLLGVIPQRNLTNNNQ
jgi:hypothetical protein